jgi:hypothetical protein
MKTLIAYCGKLGAGKNYQMMKHIDVLKDKGNQIYLIAFADCFKKFIEDTFGLTKAGRINDGTISKEWGSITKDSTRYEVVLFTFNLIQTLKYKQFTTYSTEDLLELIEDNYIKHEEEFFKYIQGAREFDGKEYDFCFRKILQLLGTELGRHIVDSIWVDVVFYNVSQVFKQNLADYAFIPDCRFLNEYAAINEYKAVSGYDCQIYGVVASDATRCLRRGLELDKLLEQDAHGSEKEVDAIISFLPPGMVIQND